MRGLLAAELLKLRTTRARYAFVLVTVALTGISVAGTIAAAADSERGEPGWQLDLVSVAGWANVVALMLGVTLVTTEWRHGTVTPAFLATPVRRRLLVAKAATGTFAGGALTILALAVVAAVALPWLWLLDVTLHLDGGTLARAARLLVAGALYGGFGAAAGILVHNQVAGIVGVILWILVVESLVVVLLGVLDVGGIADVLPGRALSALDGSIDDGLRPSVGALAAIAWIVGILALGVVRTERSDVT